MNKLFACYLLFIGLVILGGCSDDDPADEWVGTYPSPQSLTNFPNPAMMRRIRIILGEIENLALIFCRGSTHQIRSND